MRSVALLLLGVCLGIYTAIVQSQRIVIDATTIPTGVILTLAVLVPIARAGAWAMNSRLGALAIGVGWLIGTLAMGTNTPWGDLVLDSGKRQIFYLVMGSILLAAAAIVPLVERPARGRPDDRPVPAGDGLEVPDVDG